MRALFALCALLALLFATPALAGDNRLLLGVGSGAGVAPSCTGGYQGPGDAVAGASHAWGIEAYTCVYAGGTGKLMNIVRASDSHACDVLSATNGVMGLTANCGTGGDNGQSAASFCTSTTCAVATLYDQVGTSNATQATAVKRPALIFTGCLTITGGGPCLNYASASSQTLNTATITSIAVPVSAATVEGYVNPGASGAIIATSGANSFELLMGFASNGAKMLDGNSGPLQTCALLAAHSLIGVDQGTSASTSITCDNTTTSGAAGASNGMNGSVGLGSFTTGDFVNGNWEEAIVYPFAENTIQLTASCHSARIRYGLGGSC